MVDPRGELDLAAEALAEGLVGRRRGGQELQRVGMPRLEVFRPVDAGELALPQAFGQAETAEGPAAVGAGRGPGRRGGGTCDGRFSVGRGGGPQQGVVTGPATRVHQREPGRGHLVQQPLRVCRMGTRLEAPQVGHTLIGGVGDDVRVGLEAGNPQQPVMIRRLLLGRDRQPLVIGIELLLHHDGLQFFGPAERITPASPLGKNHSPV